MNTTTIAGLALAVSLAAGIVGPVTPAAAASTSVSTVRIATGTAAVKAISIKSPSGTCKRTAAGIVPPSDRGRICSYGVQLIGHAYPKPKKPGYAQNVAAKLKAGGYVMYQNHLWKVSWKKSIRKGSLPREAWLRSSSTVRYLVTCDPKSGYRNGHSKNNLVVRMVRVR